MLRDRYYLGYVTYKGEEIQGRHDPLIDDDLFNRIQDILDSRSTAKERRRVHHHYLKGSLFCGRCKRVGVTQRMIVQHTVNRRGAEYTYFFCRNKQNGTCQAPHINVALVEDAVEAHYATIRFSTRFVADVRAHTARVIDEQEAAERLLHEQLTNELQALDAREENLIELAADGDIPQLKIKTKLREIASQRRRLTERLATTTQNLSDSARLIEIGLKLLENPQELYRRAMTNSAECSTRRSSTASTSTTTTSPITASTSRSHGSTQSNRRGRQHKTTSRPSEPTPNKKTRIRPPPGRRAAECQRMASGSY
jgi:site-specific DNA recombinase